MADVFYPARELQRLTWHDRVPRHCSIHLDLGTGLGHFTTDMAIRYPETFWVAIELEGPIARRAARRICRAGLDNAIVLCADARQVMYEWIPFAALDHVWVNFPDPWPKDRHADRRHTHPWMLHLLAARLRTGGGLHLATDVPEYAVAFTEALEHDPCWIADHEWRRAETGVVTKYERKWLEQGRRPTYADWTRSSAPVDDTWPLSISRCSAPSLDPEQLPLPPGTHQYGAYLLKLFPACDRLQHGVLIDRKTGYDQHCTIDVYSGSVELNGVWCAWKRQMFEQAVQPRR